MESVSVHAIIGYNLRPALLILRFFGSHPFSTIKTDDGKTKWVWKFASWATLYSYFSVVSFHILFAFWIIHYIENTNTISGIPFADLNISSVEKLCLHIFPIVHPILASLFILSSVLSTPTIIEIVHNWDIFENKFQEAFPKSGPAFKNRFVLQKRGMFVGILLTGFMTFSTNEVNEKSCQFLERVPYMSRKIIPYICYIFGNFTWYTAIHSLFEDVKFIILLRANLIAMSQVLCQIKLQPSSLPDLQITGKDKFNAESVMVKKLCSLVLHIRKQIKLTGRAMSFGHLPSILIMFAIFCLSLFMGAMIHFAGGRHPIIGDITRKATMLYWIMGFKLIVKALLAERATKLEQDISNEFRRFKGVSIDKMSRLEMSILINHLDSNPAKIDLGGILVLNASLLLKMAGQVATYLVVLFQFHNMESNVN